MDIKYTTPKKFTLDLRVTGKIRELKQFLKLCKLMDMLGSQGSTRTITIWYDGDGSARLRMSMYNGKEWIPIDDSFLEKIDTDKDEIKIDFD